MASYLPHPDKGFKIAERVVKQLIYSYIEMFKRDNIMELSHKLQVSYFRIPVGYINQETSLSHMRNLPDGFIKVGSLYYLPEKSDCGTFKMVPRPGDISTKNENWEIHLILVDIGEANPNLNETNLEQFGRMKDELVKIVSGILNGARGVFYYLKRTFQQELETLDMQLEDNSVILVDSLFPNYRHHLKISYKLIQIKD